MQISEIGSVKPFAVVTGGSSGIGYELARQFAQNGYDVLIAAEDEGVAKAAQSIRGAIVDSIRVDLSKFEGVQKLYERIRSTGRPVDAIAINAGVGVHGDFVRDVKLEDALNVIQLNVASSVHLTKLVVKDMVDRGRGKVLFTSSIASTLPGPFEAIYAASKAFLQSFSQAIRNELRDTGVTVTSLMPGPTETNFFRRAGMMDTKLGANRKDDAELVAQQGFRAMMAGKDHVVAGSLKNRLETMAAKFLPETLKAQLHRNRSEPGSAGKKAA